MGSYAQALQHKQALSDEDRQSQADDLIKTKLNTMANLPSIKGRYGEGSPQWNDALQTIAQSKYDLHQLYHPIKRPGALQADWHFLLEKLHGIKQPKGMDKPSSSSKKSTGNQDSPAAPNTSQAAQAGAPASSQAAAPSPAANTPVVPPAGAQVPPAAAPLTWKTRGQWQSPKELKQKAEAMQKAQEQAGLLASGTGLTPQEQATLKVRGEAVAKQSEADSSIKLYDHLFPNATQEDKDRFKNIVVENLLGGKAGTMVGKWGLVKGKINGQDVTLQHDEKTGEYRYATGESIPTDLLSNFVPDPKPMAKKGLSYVPATGMVKDGDTGQLYSMADIGKPGAPISILPIFMGAKAMMDKKQQDAIELANVRQNAYMKIIVNPNDPSQLVWATPAQAAGKEAPNSVDQKLMMPTASERQRADFAISAHDQLKDMEDILKSRPDMFGPGSGQYTNFTQWIGSQDPDAQRFRVAAQVLSDHAMAVFGARSQYASESIFSLVGQNGTNPTAAMAGLKQLDKALETIGGRGSGVIPPGSGAAQLGYAPKSKGAVSVMKAMGLPKYKGKSKKEVSDAITAQGYTPVP